MSALLNNSKEDILYFKDEILKDIKKFEIKIGQKSDLQASEVKAKLNEYDVKMKAMIEKINNLSTQISANTSMQEKINSVYGFKTKVQEDLMLQEIKIDTTVKELKDAINKYDAILLDSVIYKGVIGMGGKFSNFHELIDYILNNINQLNIAKEKIIMESKNTKKKNDTSFQNIKNQLETLNKSVKEINKKIFDFIEERFSKIEDDNAQKFIDVRMANNKYAEELIKKAELLNDNYKKVEKIKNEIEERIKYEINKIHNLPGDYGERLNNFQDELDAIKIEFFNLSDMIKNNKFIIKEGENKTNNQKNIAKPHAESLLKKYINGEISADKFNKKKKIQSNQPNHFQEEAKVEEKNKVVQNECDNKLQHINLVEIDKIELLKEEYSQQNKNNKEKEIMKKENKNKDIFNQKNNNNIKKEENKNEINSDSINKKKTYIMNLANEAEIVVKDNKKNEDFFNNSFEQKVKNNSFNQNIKNNLSKYSPNNFKENYLLNNAEDLENMINLYNIYHEKYKENIETNEKGTNTLFPDQLERIYNQKSPFNRNNSANSSHKRINEFNEEQSIYDSQKNSINHSYYFEEKHNYPEVNMLGTGLIEVINYNKILKKKNNKENKKGNILEFIQKSYDDQEINDEKKLIQLKNAIDFNNMIKNSIENRNNHDNKKIFSNTLSHSFRRNNIKNFLKKEKYQNKNNHNKYQDNNSGSYIIQNDRKKNKSFIILEKINLENYNKKNLKLDNFKGNYKKLNPIIFKGNNSTTNIRQKLLKKEDLNDKKFGNLVNRIKEMIPYEEKISFFDTSNIEKLNKSVFSQRKNFYDANKKDKNDYPKNKELVMKRVRALCQNEPKNIYNINNQINLINSD